jgi:DNA-binding transcriptional MerR regulator
MSSRTYLSIGDVLGLLRQEFPDVTISKIRFLESQGLVNPERTPSGYRKFYENDVERLRWVLRQQREHFLPLKVIKGRLEQEVPDGGGTDESDTEDSGLDRVEASARTESALAAQGAAGAGRTDSASTVRGAGRAASVTGPAATHPSAHPSSRASSHPAARVRAVSSSMAGAATRASSSTTATKTAAPETVATETVATETVATETVATETVAKVEAAEWRARVRAGQGRSQPQSDQGASSMLPTLPGNSVTTEELAVASGLDAGAVAQLESYGLLCGRVVGGVTYFDEDALVVARLAAAFAQFGVEARHLRLHKHAAEREAGFIEQIVLPVLRQRNPEARQRALETVTELSRLGQGLREVLLRVALRNQLGG